MEQQRDRERLEVPKGASERKVQRQPGHLRKLKPTAADNRLRHHLNSLPSPSCHTPRSLRCFRSHRLHRAGCTGPVATSSPGGGGGDAWTSGAAKETNGAGQRFSQRPLRCCSLRCFLPPHSRFVPGDSSLLSGNQSQREGVSKSDGGPVGWGARWLPSCLEEATVASWVALGRLPPEIPQLASPLHTCVNAMPGEL